MSFLGIDFSTHQHFALGLLQKDYYERTLVACYASFSKNEKNEKIL